MEGEIAKSESLGGGKTTTTIDWSALGLKLYGRDNEMKLLRDAFERAVLVHRVGMEVAMENPALVLITGKSGSGKTALARCLHPLVEQSSGYFLTGKFDQLQRTENYYPIVEAFTSFVDQAMKRDEITIRTLKDAIAPLSEHAMLLDLVPALERLIPRTRRIDTKGIGSDQRLVFAVQEFIRSVCSPNRPLVLFIDDLQWAQPASLNLVAGLLTDRTIRGLMVIGACRANDVAMDAPLSVMLRELEANAIDICNVPVANIDRESVHEMLSDILVVPEERCVELVDLMYDATGGNTFFIVHLLRMLIDNGLLRREKGSWLWQSPETIKTHIDSDDPVRLLANSLRKLSPPSQNALMIASCFGAEFDELLLQKVVSGDIGQSLMTATDAGLVVQTSPRRWRFTHDIVQMSAYSLIPETDRAAVHLQNGRKLLSTLNPDELNTNIFLVVTQLRLGARLITDSTERERMAMLLLHAGQKATESSDFHTAAFHLNLGIDFLGSRHWRDQYHLSLDLYNSAAEVEYCNAKYSRMDELIKGVLGNARNQIDKTRALTTSMYSLGGRNELQEAINLGFNALRDLGFLFPKDGSLLRLLFQIMQTKRLLRRITDSEILSLPLMHDAAKLASMRLMNLMFAYTLYGRPILAPTIAVRLVQTTLQHGLSGMSCVGFAAFAMLLCGPLGDTDLGLRLANISLMVLEKFDAKEWIPRTYTAVYGFCFPCTVSLESQCKPLLISHRVGMGTGDIEFSMMSASLHSAVAFYSSIPLPTVINDTAAFLELMKIHKQTTLIQFIRPTMQLMLNLSGKSETLSFLTGDAMNEEEAMKEAVETKNMTSIVNLHLVKLILLSYSRDYESADRVAKQLAKCNNSSFTCFTLAQQALHASIAALASCKGRPRRAVSIARRYLRMLKSLAYRLPSDYLNKVLLVEAEIAAANGKYSDAISKYKRSIECAQAARLLNEEGMACERLALAFEACNRKPEAQLYAIQAINAYELWGAVAISAPLKSRETQEGGR